jgi:hypothetical protein
LGVFVRQKGIFDRALHNIPLKHPNPNS